MANVAAMANPPPNPHDPQYADNALATSWEGDRMFNIYIYDYCNKRGFKKTALQLVQEAELDANSQPPINAKQGLLFEWWSVFWVLFTAKSTTGGTEDAQAYVQYVTRQRAGTAQPTQPARFMTNGPGRPPPLGGAPGTLMSNGVPGAFALGPQLPNGIHGAPGGPPQPGAPGIPNQSPQQTHFPPGGMIPPHAQQGQPGQPPQQGRPGGPPMPGQPQHAQQPQHPQQPQQQQQQQLSFPPPGAPPGSAVAAAQRAMGMFHSPTMAPSPQAGGGMPGGAQQNRGMHPPHGNAPFPPGMHNSRPNTPGTKPPVGGPPQHGMQQQQSPMGMTEIQQLDAELSRVVPAVLGQLKADLKIERDFGSMTVDDKRQLVSIARGIPAGGLLPGNAIPGPSAPNNNNNGKGPMAPPGRPQPGPNATQRVKRSSTSPTDEHEMIKTESSPPDRKRPKTTPVGNEPPMQHQKPPQSSPGFPPQQQPGGMPGQMNGLPGQNVMNGAMSRQGMPPNVIMSGQPQPGMAGGPPLPGVQFQNPGGHPGGMPMNPAAMMGHGPGGAGAQMMSMNGMHHPVSPMNAAGMINQQKKLQDWHLSAMNGGTGSPAGSDPTAFGAFGPPGMHGGASPLGGVMPPGGQQANNKPPAGMPPPPSPGTKMGGPQPPLPPGGQKESPRLMGMRPPGQQPPQQLQQLQQQQSQPGSMAGTPQLAPAGTNPSTPVTQQRKVPSPAALPTGGPPGGMGGAHGPGSSAHPPPQQQQPPSLAGTGPGGFGGVDFGPGIFGEGFMVDSLGDGDDIDTFSFLNSQQEGNMSFNRAMEDWYNPLGGGPLGGEDSMMK